MKKYSLLRCFTVLMQILFFTIPKLQAQTQISANYDCDTKSAFYLPINGGAEVAGDNLKNFVGSFDTDDGVVLDVPVGFNFIYNGNTYNTVNICVNGWVSVGHLTTIPTITSNKNNLFVPASPNNVLAPLWGDHVDRLAADAANGFKPSAIKYATNEKADTNINTDPGSFIHTFIVEWKDLNINDKTDPNSIANFQVWIIEDPLTNSKVNPDKRASIEFHYGAIGEINDNKVRGCTIGINDSFGGSFMNGLFKSSFANGDSTRSSLDVTSSCWPPPNCDANTVIVFTPKKVSAGVSNEKLNTSLHFKNYPNPFNQSTKIRFYLREDDYVSLKVYDLCGREVASLMSGHQNAGDCEVNFDGSTLPSGMYEYRLQAGALTEIRKMNLVK